MPFKVNTMLKKPGVFSVAPVGALDAESHRVLAEKVEAVLSQNPDLVIFDMEFVNYITSPEGQARLATSSCYWGMPANAKAGDALTPEQKAVLRWDQQPEFLARAQLYPIPDAALDTAMQDMWTEMLAQ